MVALRHAADLIEKELPFGYVVRILAILGCRMIPRDSCVDIEVHKLSGSKKEVESRGGISSRVGTFRLWLDDAISTKNIVAQIKEKLNERST